MAKVLLVEDDPALNNNIREALQAEGFDVVSVYDGGLAERMIQKQTFDMLILDINLPGKNGFDLCQYFRTVDQHTPVLMLTAFDELDDKVKGYESGADDYLTKPFYMRELLLRVQALLKRRELSGAAQAQGQVLAIDDLVINLATKKVTRQEREIQLTPREYQILVQLVENKGELVPKKELIRNIWGTSFDANTNTIEVYINFLRNKVDKPFGKQSIKTKVGFGYYFDIV